MVEGEQPSGRYLDQTIFSDSEHLASQTLPSRNLKADLVNSAEPPFRFFLNRGNPARFPQKLAKAF